MGGTTHGAGAGRAGIARNESRRAVAAAGVGNALEFYDFVTFTFFAIQIGRTFFPSESPYLSLMASFATFGAGFFARPVGAYYLGRMSDRTGRKPVLMLSMVLMGIGTALLVLTPGYATIGWAAPVLAVVARLVQGFALGGEVGAASSYMIEAAVEHRRGWAISWQQASQSISGMIGSGIGLVISLTMSAKELESYGWRIALGIGLVIVPFALVIRRSIPETHGTEAAPKLKPPHDSSYRRTCIIGFILIGMSTISTYAFNYQASFAQAKLGFSPSVALAGQVAGYFVGLVFGLVGGALSDIVGRRPLIIGSRALYALLILPVLTWQVEAHDPLVMILSSALVIIPAAMGAGAVFAAIAENLPQSVRATSFALIYSLPVTILGGSTQLVLEWLIHVTGNPLSVGWYLTGVALVSGVAALFLPESAPRRRRQAEAIYAAA